MSEIIDAHALSDFVYLADADLKLISVFDDIRYDRADIDILSVGMRIHAVKQLAKTGFEQTSGNVLTHKASGARCIIPKSHTLGASPFDIVRYTPKRDIDFYLLTPTQTAGQLIDSYETDEAVARIKTLIARHPINIDRLTDFLDQSKVHRSFTQAMGYLKYVQRQAVESDRLCRRRPLG